MIVYGCSISYFTGKFESYLRYKEIPYRAEPLTTRRYLWTVPRRLGAAQYPSVELDDGRWMSDTTPMIAWLEGEHPEPPVIPSDPVQAYVALLVEDFADEWLWRPAMHYRWSYEPDRRRAGTVLAQEIVTSPLPLAQRRRWVTARQTRIFVEGDGIDSETRAHAESSYTRLLGLLEPVLTARPFLLGERPTIADFGLMGPFWRHFASDPTPAALMRERAPAVWEWAHRCWSARASVLAGRPLVGGVPADLLPLMREVGEAHLEALAANAIAHRDGEDRHSFTVQGTIYRSVPTSAYRVWCLEQLRARYERLAPAAANDVRALLEEQGCWEPLWRAGPIASGHDPAGEAPFCRALRMIPD